MLQPGAKGSNQGIGVFARIAAARQVGRTLLNRTGDEIEFRPVGVFPAQIFQERGGFRIAQVFLVDIYAESDPQKCRGEPDILQWVANMKIYPLFGRNRRGGGGFTDFGNPGHPNRFQAKKRQGIRLRQHRLHAQRSPGYQKNRLRLCYPAPFLASRAFCSNSWNKLRSSEPCAAS